MSKLLPLFPLQLVVFPGSAIPLHIFEERYKHMVGEAEAAGSEFGIVLARDDGIVNSGCTVVVESVLNRYDDGRLDVMTRGQRRFMIQAVNQELDYLRGDVEYFEDEDFTSVPHGLRTRVIESFRRLNDSVLIEPDDPYLSFQLVRVIQDLDFQNVMQRSRSELERFHKLDGAIGSFIERRDYATKMRAIAPTNGAGHKPKSM
jgi:hypothetical protein